MPDPRIFPIESAIDTQAVVGKGNMKMAVNRLTIRSIPPCGSIPPSGEENK